jgi:hypothetical protein
VGRSEEAGVDRSEEAGDTEKAVEAVWADSSRHTRHMVVAALSAPAPPVADGYQRNRTVDRVAYGGGLSPGAGRRRWLWLRRANFVLLGAKTRMSGCGDCRWT